ncbi:hypothetical protein [Microtetraspora malaysiensis]|uniref:hypothetical protein n=1 Tax=Microtetraspora malaysiensis TaxID=161358 RepID=UPI003D926FA9
MRFLYAAVAAASLLAVAGCGGAEAGAGAAAGGDQRAAYLNCLRENGVTLPSGRPGGRPSREPGGDADGQAGRAGAGGQGDGASGDAPSDASSPRPSRGPGGFRSMSPEMRKAMEACRSLMPEGGRGWGGRGPGGDEGRDPGAADVAAMRPFRTCMKDNGAEIAEGKNWRDLGQDDPKVAAALKKCRILLPAPSPQPS